MKSVTKYLRNCRSYSDTGYEKSISPDIHNDFKKSLSKITDDVAKRKNYVSYPGVLDKIKKAAEYNRNFGKNPSGMIMLHSLNVLDQIGSSTSSAMHQAFTLTWGIEMLHSYDLLEDIKHREHIGNKSNTDTDYANLLRSFLYAMLEDNCSNNFVQLFNKGFLFISLGKYIANDISSKGKIEKYSNFNMNTYELLCEYKTAFNTYKLPLIIASQLSRQSKIHNHIDKIGTDLGKLYQIKNEYEDCFGGESKTYRSAGVNIQQGKCTWLAVTALQRCTAAQRIVFNTCYGSNEPAHVERIKSLYERLNIPQLYRETEGALNESIMQRAETAGVPLELFSSLLETLNVE